MLNLDKSKFVKDFLYLNFQLLYSWTFSGLHYT